MLKQMVASTLMLGVHFMSYASDAAPLVLDTVNVQFVAKDWVRTEKALLQLNVNMVLNNADMVQARKDVLRHLKTIADGDWHITSFDRSQDRSGLERLMVNAQARVLQNTLTDVYTLAKKASKPGASYKVSAIDFTPSLEDRQAVKNKLRANLYQQVQNELAALNKMYPSQNYSVHDLRFAEGDAPITPSRYKARDMNTMVMAAAPAAEISVSNEMLLTVVASLASNRNNKAPENHA